LHLAVRALVNRYDPAGLIEAGFPDNEYEPEVRDLVALLRSDQVIDVDATNEIWERWFHDRPLLDRVGKSTAFTEELAKLRDAV
jgi:hypothetical protein